MINKIAGKDTESIFALTPMQQGLLFHYLKGPRGEYYFNQLDLEVSGEIDLKCFEKAWNLVIETNEVLRTVFRWEKLEKPIQVVLKKYTLHLHYEDLSMIGDRKEQNRQWIIIKHRDRERQFDLRRVPFRVILCKMAENHYHILISNHHILYDGWSTGIILKEFFQAYEILEKGDQPPLAPVKPGFKEFIRWHGEQDLNEQKKFWQNYLEGIETPTQLPVKQLKQSPGDPGERNYRLHLKKTVKDRLEIFVKEKHLSLAAVFYSSWGLLLQKYCRQEDVVFGTIVSGRLAPIREIENMVGLFINTIPHRAGFEPGETLLDFLVRINSRLAAVGKYENTPLVDIYGCTQRSNQVREELFDTIVAVENYPLDTYLRELGPRLSIRSYSMDERPHYDLTLVIAAGEGIDINFVYNNRLFEKDTVVRLASHFRKILEGIKENAHNRVDKVDMLSVEEKHQLIKEFNRTETFFPGEKIIHRLFAEQVERTPDNIALVGPHQVKYRTYISYRELNDTIDGLAHKLIEKGIPPDTIVGIMVERSIEMVTGILGILKAGGAYLPIDPGYPEERINYMLKDSNVGVLVTTPKLQVKVKAEVEENFRQTLLPLQFIDIKAYPAFASEPSPSTLASTSTCQVSPTNLAYIIYTSGSTGKPKGVIVQHGSVVNLLWAMQSRYPLGERDTYLLKTSYMFDVSVAELFGWFFEGGRLAVLEPGDEKDPKKIIDAIEHYRVSHINFVPSMFNAFTGALEPGIMGRLSGLKYIFLAGEALPPGTVARFRQLNAMVALENIYGPTEATVYASWYSLSDGTGEGPIPIGKPLPNVGLYILDHWNNLQPIGVPGELCISGPGLARGYLNNPGLTFEKFCLRRPGAPRRGGPICCANRLCWFSFVSGLGRDMMRNSLLSFPSSHLPNFSASLFSPPRKNFLLEGTRGLATYYTGDLARWLPDGNIEFLGRMDFQVKVRGFRIEPGEIENRLVNHPQVKKAVVTAHKDKTGEVTLCAYVVSTAAVDELRGYLAGVLPGYMVPAYFEKIKTIPLTPSAKIDRKALPVPVMKSRREYIQPRNELEKNLVKIWSEVLGIDKKKIGINDHFFELGGHSLKAAALISKIHKQLNVKLPIPGLFKTPRLGDLAAYIKNSGQQSRIHGHVPIEPVEKKEYYPLSPAQKRLYILQQFTAANTSYNMPYILPLEQPADRHNPKETLEIVFKTLIARHESLRTSFETINEKPVQRIHESVDFEIKFHHHEKWKGEEVIIENLLRPFDLSRAPLLRVELIKTGEGTLSIFVDMHHIITDGTSQNILEKEFITLYRDRGKRLSGQRLQYRDYSQWVNHPRQQESREQQKNYWLRQFLPGKELPVLNLPTDNPRPLVQSIEGNWVHFALNPRETKILRTIARDNDVTLFMCLLAVFNVLFSRLSGQEDIILGVPTAARRHTDLQQVMGMLVNTLVIRNYPSGDKTFSQFLKEIKKRTLEAYENQEYPFEELVDHISVNRDTGRNPLFDILLNLLNQWEYHHENREMKGDTEPPYHHRKGTSRFDMAFSAIQLEEHISFDLEYSTNLYKPDTIDRFIKYLKMIVQSLPGNTHQKMTKIEMLSAEEKKEILRISNGIEEIFRTKRTIHELYQEQSAKTPDHIAVVGHEPWPLQLTYRELNERANQLAHLLKEKGVSADSVAGIILERSVEMIVGILGILKAEAAYLPIDFDYPPERISLVLSDSGASVVLTRGKIFDRIPLTSLKNMTVSHAHRNLLVTPPRAQTSDFDAIPKPDRTLVNYEKYHQSIGIAMAKHTVSIQATRGCPFHCAFCHKIWSKKHISRKAENILEEIRCIYDAGVRRFVFIDDIFNLDRKNSMEIFEKIIKQGLDIQLFFPNGLRGDILTKDFIDLLIEAGAVNIDLALESASPRIQQLIRKNLNLEKFAENTRYINRKYPQVLLEMELMIGFPTETEKEALSTLEFLESLKWVHFPNLNILKIYPNTDMYTLALENGISKERIQRSANLAYHELPETLPFSKTFVREYQARFMNRYFLSRERLLQVLPHQVRTLTEDELVQKYDSYLPMEIKNFSDILRSAEIPGHRLGPIEFLPPDHMAAPGFREKVRRFFPVPPEVENPFRVLLVDLSLFFCTREQRKQMLYDMVEEPLGLMYLASYLDEKFSGRVSTRIIKSRIDFDSFEELKNIIMEFRPGLIGIRTLSYYKEFFHRAVLLIRHWRITTPIIAGGPYATSDYHLILQDPHVDVVVLGEGEITFGLLVEKIMANNNQLPGEDVLKEIQGIAFARNRHKKNSPAKQTTREILLLDKVAETLASYPRHNPGYTNQPGNLLYIIYTSGSTGAPKGVMLEQRNLINLIQYQYRHTEIDFSRVLQFTTISFDVSAQEIFSTLLAGGRLSMVNKETLTEVPKLFKLVERNQIKTLFLPASFLKFVMNEESFIQMLSNSISHIVTAGEQVVVNEIFKKYLKMKKVCFHNHYGPSETHVVTAFTMSTTAKIPKLPPIGRPVMNTLIYILDKVYQLAPIRVPGEIFIGGSQVGRGYLNNPELTCEKFKIINYKLKIKNGSGALWADLDAFGEEEQKVPGKNHMQSCNHASMPSPHHPITPSPQSPLYRTGDLGQWLLDGNIEFLGRLDHQVKIRGFRIELGEIEHQLLTHEKIKEAFLMAREDNNDKFLCAYIVAQPKETNPIDQSGLREYLSNRLPDYMLPSYFVQLDEVPLTPNGKVDRKALPEPGPEMKTRKNYIAPRNEIEKKLAAIWSEVLDVEKEKISINDNFFHLGGHSLKATIMAAIIQKELKVKISLTQIFSTPHIKGLSAYVKTLTRETQTPVEPVEKKEYYVLSTVQERLYIARQLDLENTAYNLPAIYPLPGWINTEELEKYFKELINRHESLRTSFHMTAGKPVQKVHDQVEFEIEYYQVEEKRTGGTGGLAPLPIEPEARAPQPAAALISSFVRSFDLSQAPLLRARLIKEREQTYLLMVDMHHIISDEISLNTIVKEFLALAAGETLAPQPIQYKDYACWRTADQTRQTIQRQAGYWQRQLKGKIPGMKLPLDFPRPDHFYFKGNTLTFNLDSPQERGLKKLANDENVTLFMLLLAIFNVMLAKICGQEDIVVGTVVAGRPHADLRNIIGFFVNQLVLISSPQKEKTFTQYLKEVKNQVLEAFENQDYPLEELIEQLEIKRKPGRHPLFDVVFTLNRVEIDNDPRDQEETRREIAEEYRVQNPTAKYDLVLAGLERGETLSFSIEYAARLFKEETIRRLIGYIKEIAAAVLQDKHIRLEDIQLSSHLVKTQTGVFDPNLEEFEI